MSDIDWKYAELIGDCLSGEQVTTRNSDCYRAVCLRTRFTDTPLVGVRKTAWKNALREWEWFMSGSNDIATLDPRVHHWWKPWANADGRVRFNYSVQFRQAMGQRAEATDQIARLVEGIRNHPYSRRHVITTWNAADMLHPECPITNCHNTVTQCFVDGTGALNMKTYQRSADMVCGLPANWIQQWAFLMWLGRRAGRRVGWLEWEGGDCHVYAQHLSLAQRIVREAFDGPAARSEAPQLVYNPTSDEFRAEDFTLSCEYTPLITEKAEMVV